MKTSLILGAILCVAPAAGCRVYVDPYPVHAHIHEWWFYPDHHVYYCAHHDHYWYRDDHHGWLTVSVLPAHIHLDAAVVLDARVEEPWRDFALHVERHPPGSGVAGRAPGHLKRPGEPARDFAPGHQKPPKEGAAPDAPGHADPPGHANPPGPPPKPDPGPGPGKGKGKGKGKG